MDIKEVLTKNNISFSENVLLKELTTFKIGGPCDIFTEPQSVDELLKTVKLFRDNEYPFFIIGNGSNLLVSDLGIEGAVIKIGSKISDISVNGTEIKAYSGAKLSYLCNAAKEAGLSGVECLWGIPGTIGGAVFMNAGAYGGDISRVIVSAEYLDSNGNISEIQKDDMDLGYRHSIFKENGGIILSATFNLVPADITSIRITMDELINRRKEKQPLEYPSAGSVFKRPEGYFAGTLIEGAGLKGTSVGGAMVSEKHAGFIINTGDATANDVRRLIEIIKEKVFLTNSVNLESEIIFIGR